MSRCHWFASDVMPQRRSLWGVRLLMHGLTSTIAFPWIGVAVLLMAIAPSALAMNSQVREDTEERLLDHPLQLDHPFVAQRRRERPIILGVVRSNENAQQWPTIAARLDALGLAYQVVQLETLNHPRELEEFTVLFLPNVPMITSGQIITLGSWLNDGGRLIVSGNVGDRSSAGVRQALQSMIGGYWFAPVSSPTTLTIQADRSEPWINQGTDAAEIQGGAIAPTGLTSDILATWDDVEIPVSIQNLSGDALSLENPVAPAILTSERSTFLGWYWGDETRSTADFDQTWLLAALSRYGSIEATERIASSGRSPQNRPSNNPSSADPSEVIQSAINPATSISISLENTELITPRSPDSSPQSTGSRSEPDNARQSEREASASANGERSPSETQVTGNREAQNSEAQSADPDPVSTRSALPTPEPASRPVPALPVPQPAEAIAQNHTCTAQELSTVLPAVSIGEERENLVGRYESAVLAASAFAGPSLLDATQENSADSALVANVEESQITEEPREGVVSLSTPLTDQVRRHLNNSWQLHLQGDDLSARCEWFQARQMLWSRFPVNHALTQPEIRAIWLDRGTVVGAGNRQALAQVFDRLAVAGINTVYIETVNAGYPIYPSRVAPQQNPLTRHWDPLAVAIELAHERGMEIHAWVWTFAAGNTRHNELLGQSYSYPGPLISANPDWAGYDNAGRMIPPGQTKPFLDPANPAVRSYLLRLFEEIVTEYDVDGLQLDYIRYPFQDASANRSYGYGTAARQQFQALTGVDPINLSPFGDRQLWEQWTEFRVQQVTTFVAEVSQMLDRHDPNLLLSAAVFGMSEHDRTHDIQQNWEVWAQQGYVDLLLTMSYLNDDLDTFFLNDHNNAEQWLHHEDLGNTLIIPGIRLLSLSDLAVVDQIQYIRDMPAVGYALFAAENLNNNDNLTAILHHTQGDPQLQRPIPYRDPFATALERYESLLQEWQHWSDQGGILVSNRNWSVWRSQVADLHEALVALEQNPTPQRLNQAQRQLDNLQAEFSQTVIANHYRVRTWENRLRVLSTLLNYGEQTL